MEQDKQDISQFTRKALVLTGLVILVAMLYFLRSLVLISFLAVLIAILWSAMTRFLQRFTRVAKPRGVWVTVSALFSMGVFGGAVYLLFAPVSDQLQELVEFIPQQLDEFMEQLMPWLQRLGIGEEALETFEAGALFEEATEAAIDAMGLGLSAALSLLVTLLLAFYTALNPERYRRGVVRMAPVRYRERTTFILNDLHEILLQWLIAAGIMIVLVGTLAGLSFWIIGIPYALLFAIAAGMLELIPYLGPTLAFTIPFLVALTISVPHAIAVAVAWAAIQTLEAGFITPAILAVKVALPPTLTILVIVGMGQLFGFLGILLATPILAVVLRTLDHLIPELT